MAQALKKYPVVGIYRGTGLSLLALGQGGEGAPDHTR